MSVRHKGRKNYYFISKLHLEYLTPELIPLLSNSWKQKWPNYAQPPAHFSVNSDESHMQIWPVFIRWKVYVNSSLCLSCWSNPGQSKPLPQTQDFSSFMISLVSFLSVSVQKGLNLRQGRAKSLIYHLKLVELEQLNMKRQRWPEKSDCSPLVKGGTLQQMYRIEIKRTSVLITWWCANFQVLWRQRIMQWHWCEPL